MTIPQHSTRSERRRQQQAHRRGIVAAIAIIGVGLTAWLVVGGSGGNDQPQLAESTTTTAAPTTTSAPSAPAPPAALIGTTNVDKLRAFATPDASAKVVATLSSHTDYGLARTLLVVQQLPGWLQALLPIRPNGTTGWIRDTDVTMSTTTLAISISLGTHQLVVTDAGQPVLTTQVVVGKDKTPTPLGQFYVTDPVDLTSSPNGFYGAYALGLSGYSEVLQHFRGGPGQIAVHGTPNRDELGKNISNGCVRVPNDVILQIAKLVPLGTPVTITA